MVVIRSREININGDQKSRKQPAAISPHVEEMARLVIAEGGSTFEELRYNLPTKWTLIKTNMRSPAGCVVAGSLLDVGTDKP